MNNVLEIDKDFNFDTICLANPTPLTGGSHFTKASLGNYSKNIYLQLPKCLTKQGIVKNNTKMYCDLMFNNNEKELIEWFENFELICQKKIYEKKDLWFHNDIETNDIEEMMNPIMRSYKSGKNILIRTQIKNSKCVAYDENQNMINLEDLKGEHYIIPLINIDGIKFTSKNFQIDIYLTQLMILIPQDEFEKSCLIKIGNREIKNSLGDTDKKRKNETLDIDMVKKNQDIETEGFNQFDSANSEDTKLDNEDVDDKNAENVDNKDVDEAESEAESEAETEAEAASESKIKNMNTQLDDFLIEPNVDLDNQVKGNLEEINLDNINLTEVNLDTLDASDSVSLKKPNEVYYEIYKEARKKAKQLRQNAMEAYLEAKNIKKKYFLEGLDDSDEDDIINNCKIKEY